MAEVTADDYARASAEAVADYLKSNPLAAARMGLRDGEAPDEELLEHLKALSEKLFGLPALA